MIYMVLFEFRVNRSVERYDRAQATNKTTNKQTEREREIIFDHLAYCREYNIWIVGGFALMAMLSCMMCIVIDRPLYTYSIVSFDKSTHPCRIKKQQHKIYRI